MTARRFCVLDVEARLSPDAVLRVPRDRRPTIDRVALQEIYACATLVFDQAADGSFSSFKLECSELGQGGEGALLVEIAKRIDEEHRRGSVLATYNGAYDLSVLRRRAGRHWLFDRFQCPAWRTHGDRHLDLMLINSYGGGRFPSLVDACAGFGFDAWPPVPLLKLKGLPVGADKCVLDVVATAVLLFHELSFRECSPMPLARGWSSLAKALRPLLTDWPHLAPIIKHPAVREASALCAVQEVHSHLGCTDAVAGASKEIDPGQGKIA